MTQDGHRGTVWRCRKTVRRSLCEVESGEWCDEKRWLQQIHWQHKACQMSQECGGKRCRDTYILLNIFFALVINTHRHQYSLRDRWRKWILAEKDLETLMNTSSTTSTNVPLWQRRSLVLWPVLSKALTADQGRWCFSSAKHWWDTSGVLSPALVF